jgi:hypothetical protein
MSDVVSHSTILVLWQRGTEVDDGAFRVAATNLIQKFCYAPESEERCLGPQSASHAIDWKTP